MTNERRIIVYNPWENAKMPSFLGANSSRGILLSYFRTINQKPVHIHKPNEDYSLWTFIQSYRVDSKVS